MSGNSSKDKEIDNLLFKEDLPKPGNDGTNPPPAASKSTTDAIDAVESGDEDSRPRTQSSNNVLPMDKLRNGATTATKILGSTFQRVKEKSSAGWEQAKTSTPGSSISNSWQKAVAVSSETIEKLKENEAYKKTSGIASAGWEKTKAGASQAKDSIAPTMEKARQTASAGIEKARTSAASGLETVRTKTGSISGPGKNGQ